jgi:hypothetical protein
MNFRFQNRARAGRLLAAKLENYAGRDGLLVLGLPPGLASRHTLVYFNPHEDAPAHPS